MPARASNAASTPASSMTASPSRRTSSRELCGGKRQRDHPRRHPAGRAARPSPTARRASSASPASTLPKTSRPPSSPASASASPRATPGRSASRPGAATSMAKPISSKKSSASTASTASPRCRCRAPMALRTPTATPAQKLDRRVRRGLAARGLDEAVTWSFLPPAEAELFGGAACTLANPISADMAAMRPSLLPGLLQRRQAQPGPRPAEHPAVRTRPALSRRRRAPERCARPRRPRPAARLAHRPRRAASTPMTPRPKRSPRSRSPARPSTASPSSRPADGWWHPGRAGRLVLGKVPLADFGLIHPATLAAFDIRGSGRGRRALSRRAAAAARPQGRAAPMPRRRCRR